MSLSRDLNVDFRKAAASGLDRDLAFMRKHLAKMDVNAAGIDSGKTALHRAAEKGHVKIINFLLSHGADPELRDKNEKNAYHYAEVNSSDEAKKTLAVWQQARQALGVAKEYFCEQPEYNTTFEDIGLNRTLLDSMWTEEIEQIGGRYASWIETNRIAKNHEVIKSALEEMRSFCNGILGAYFTLVGFKNAENRQGYCDSIASTVFFALFNAEYSVERFQVVSEDGSNHAFIILNRKKDSIQNKPSTWGGDDTLFLNWDGKIQSVAECPKNSILNLLPYLKVNICTNKIPDINVFPEGLKNLSQEVIKQMQKKVAEGLALNNIKPIQFTNPFEQRLSKRY